MNSGGNINDGLAGSVQSSGSPALQHPGPADGEDSFASVEISDCLLPSTSARPDDESAEIEELVDEIRELESDVEANLEEDDSSRHRPNVFVDDRGAVKHSVVLMCDAAKLVTPVGLLKTIISVSCVVSLACICCTDFAVLPLSPFARLHIFVLTFTLLLVALIFFIEITTLTLLFPVHWNYWNAVVHFVLCLLLNTSSSLLIHALFGSDSRLPHLDRTMELLIVSGVSGYFCALLCVLTSAFACCCYDHHLALPWKQHKQDGVLMLR